MERMEVVVTDYKGIRDDRGAKFIGNEYLINSSGFNYDSFIGADKILQPRKINEVQYQSGKNIDGEFKFNFLDANGDSQEETVFVTGGVIYKNPESPSILKSGLSEGQCTFAVLNDKLFICNGQNYPQVYDGTAVFEMGAPRASDTGNSGNPSGTYYYAVVFDTGQDEVTGTVSNTITVSSSQILLQLPIGYEGTVSRDIYRTANGGTQLKFVATVAENTSLTYTDNIADGSLGSNIPALNNECPKPFFIEAQYDRLIGCVSTKNPTNIWFTDPEIEVFDGSTFTTTAGISNDSSPLVGMKADYSLIVLGTMRNIFTLDVAGDDPTITITRANVGIKSGYTMVNVPSGNGFDGGIMFLSSMVDARVFNGNFAQPVATSLDNLKTENFSQVIQKTIDNLVRSTSRFYAAFQKYKYHLGIDNNILVFDVRNQSWWPYKNQFFNYLTNIDNVLYAGGYGDSTLYRMYQDITADGEQVEAFIESGDLLAEEKVKFFQEIHFFFVNNSANEINVEVIIDSNPRSSISETFKINGGAYNSQFYSSIFYRVSEGGNEDYRVLHVNRFGRWFKYKITSVSGRYLHRGVRVIIQNPEQNKA